MTRTISLRLSVEEWVSIRVLFRRAAKVRRRVALVAQGFGVWARMIGPHPFYRKRHRRMAGK